MDDIKIQHYDRNDDDELERTSPNGIKLWWRNEHDELELRSRKTSITENERIAPTDSRESKPNQFTDKAPNELVHIDGLPSAPNVLDNKRIDAKPKGELQLPAQWDAFF
jgi:hypothetical protein